MGLSGEWQQMVFAHARKSNVANDDNLVVLLGKDFSQMDAGVLVEPGEHFGIHPGHTGWRFQQAFTIGIFADSFKDCANGLFDRLMIDFQILPVVRRLGCGRHRFGHSAQWVIGQSALWEERWTPIATASQAGLDQIERAVNSSS